LLIEFLPGIHNDIGSELHEASKDTTTTHIIAISGFKRPSVEVQLVKALHLYEARAICSGR